MLGEHPAFGVLFGSARIERCPRYRWISWICWTALPLLLAAAAASVAALAALAATAAAAETCVIVDKTQVYYGNPKSFKKPATIVRTKVYDEIPAYKKIKDEKLDSRDARYHFLIAEASKVFGENLTKVAKDKGFDLVAELDAITVTGQPLTDLTPDVIKTIKGD
ncbi:MAG: OmpH family outer membrane protein [Planctomycetes bacterium]|nr:OmpH family outer membrane protein [Planctomycetota bacterium]